MKIRTNSENASALVEVLLSLGIIGVIGSALIGSFTYGFFMMERVRENQRATQILMEKVETLRLYRWEQVLTPGFIPTAFTDHYDPQSLSGGLPYNGTLTITNAPFTASYQTNIRQLVITLDWTSIGNIPRHRKLATLISRDGLQNYVY